MYHPLTESVHRFFIPVMGTGFTIDTPLKVARYGISSVVSLVDDVLIEQMRRRVCETAGRTYEPIADRDQDCRARRITAYLDLLHDQVQDQVARLRRTHFRVGSEITRYFEMLPPSPLRSLYETMRRTRHPVRRARLQQALRRRIVPGGIDVNIMTKLDRLRAARGEEPLAGASDALAALRGYARSKLVSSVVLSAGLNRRLYAYLREFRDFLPGPDGAFAKCIVLKVGDFRSARVQGRLLAKLGLWVSEYRIESGLNCGGHAFGGSGTLLGPVLEEFRDRRDALRADLDRCWREGLRQLGHDAPAAAPELRVTVQGGIGTAEECALLRREYGVDAVGWASPFLLVPDVVNIDAEHLAKLRAAGEDDVQLSDASPLGIPFWSLRDSASERARRDRIARGRPGSPCPKGFLIADTEFTRAPICTASRNYQRRKLAQLQELELDERARREATDAVTAKACICHDLAGSATASLGIDPAALTAVCCGPNTVYFSRVAQLREMVDHIYGRLRLPLDRRRPHMFLKELSLHLDQLRDGLALRASGLPAPRLPDPGPVVDRLQEGVGYYSSLARHHLDHCGKGFRRRLDELRRELERLHRELELQRP